MQKILPLALSLALSTLVLAGCDKKDTAPKTTTATSTTAVTTSTTSTTTVTSSTASTPTMARASSATAAMPSIAMPSSDAPMMDFWVMSSRISGIHLMTQQNPTLTDEQKNCLASPDGDASFRKELLPFFSKILTPEETAQANKFFASALGQKFSAVSKAQMEGSKTMPNVTEQETKDLMAELQKPYMVKLQKETAKADPTVGKAIVEKSIASEKARCKIA